MNHDLLTTMKAMRADHSAVVNLYRQLYEGSFVALVQRGSEGSLESMEFLTYESSGGVSELPLFTKKSYVLSGMPPDCVEVQLPGADLWLRLLDVVESGRCEAAVDPGQEHGIRLRREMILGMLGKYGPPW